MRNVLLFLVLVQQGLGRKLSVAGITGEDAVVLVHHTRVLGHEMLPHPSRTGPVFSFPS